MQYEKSTNALRAHKDQISARIKALQNELEKVEYALAVMEGQVKDFMKPDIPYSAEIKLIFLKKGDSFSAVEVGEIIMNKYDVVGSGLSQPRAKIREAIYVQLAAFVKSGCLEGDPAGYTYTGKPWPVQGNKSKKAK